MAPFPYMPMVAVLASLVSYMLVQMSVFAYAGYMVEYLGVVDHKDKSGYYAGWMSGAFMFVSLFSPHFWGVVADRFGCRMVMVVALLSTAVLPVAFGCSTTFTWAFVCRFLLGLLNGIVAASKTLVSEVCGKEHETVGMGVVTILQCLTWPAAAEGGLECSIRVSITMDHTSPACQPFSERKF